MREMAPAAARQRGGDGAAVLRQGFAKHYGGGGGVGEGEGGTKDQGKKSSISPLYIGGPRGGAGPRRSNLLGGCGQGEESLLPKAPRRCLPLLGLFLLETLGAWASWGWCPWPI